MNQEHHDNNTAVVHCFSKSSDLYKQVLLLSREHRPHFTAHHHNHETTDKLAIIIDPRYDDIMETVINNFMYYMNPEGWNLLVLSHSSHKELIMTNHPYCEFKEIDEKYMSSTSSIPNMPLASYNKIMLSQEFWRSLLCNNIAIFQKDCIMYRMFNDNFLEYDFSGANYYVSKDLTFFNGGINGGFSLRKRDKMIECLEKVSIEQLKYYKQQMYSLLDPNNPLRNVETLFSNEDVFFCWACEYLRLKTPDVEHRKRLSIEFVSELWNTSPQNIQENSNNNIYCPTTRIYTQETLKQNGLCSDKNNNPSSHIKYIPCVYHGWQHNYHNVNMAIYFLLKSNYFMKTIINVLYDNSLKSKTLSLSNKIEPNNIEFNDKKSYCVTENINYKNAYNKTDNKNHNNNKLVPLCNVFAPND